MKLSTYHFVLGAILVLLSCQSAEKSTDDKTVEPPTESLTETNTLTREKEEPAADFAKRAWKEQCASVNGTTAIGLNNHLYLISSCGSEGNYQYLLLQAISQSTQTYLRITGPTRNSDPTEEYYGFPNFSSPEITAIDANNDGTQELLMAIQVSGKSSGSGAEEETFWDETFYEVYELKNEQLQFSSALTTQYQKSLSTTTIDLTELDEISEKLAQLKGSYTQSNMIDQQLHWGTCYGQRLDIDQHHDQENYGIWVDQTMDGYGLRVNRITGDESAQTYQLFCHAPSPSGEDGFIPFNLTYKVVNGVHYFQTEENDFYVLDTDQGRIPKYPDDCEEEGG